MAKNICFMLVGASLVFLLAQKFGFAIFCGLSAAIIYYNFEGK